MRVSDRAARRSRCWCCNLSDCVFVSGVIGASYMTAAAYYLDWDLGQGHLFPEVESDGSRGALPVKPSGMRDHLKALWQQPSFRRFYTMHSFRVGGSLSESPAGTYRCRRDHEVWRVEVPTGGKRRQADDAYDRADKLPLTADIKHKYGTCSRRQSHVLRRSKQQESFAKASHPERGSGK